MTPGSRNEVRSINVIVVRNSVMKPMLSMRLVVIIMGMMKYTYRPKLSPSIMYGPMFIGESELGPVMSLPLRRNLFLDGQS